MRIGQLLGIIFLPLATLASASQDADWLRHAARVPDRGLTEWTLVVTTGHFGRDPQLADATRQAIAELLGEVGAKGDRVRIISAEMKPWGSPHVVAIEDVPGELPTAPAPGSKGGRDIEAVLEAVAVDAKGPVIIVSPGNSALPMDGSGSLRGGDGSVAGYETPVKRLISLETASGQRTARLTVLSRDRLFEGSGPRVPPAMNGQQPIVARKRSPGSGQKNGSSPPDTTFFWSFGAAGALLLGLALGFRLASVGRTTSKLDSLPDGAQPSTSEAAELTAWKDQAKQLQRRLDFMVQEIEDSVQRMSQANDVQIVELRQELMRRNRTLDGWDQLVIDFLDGVQRAIDHPHVTPEAAATWSRAASQILNLAKRFGLDEIRPLPGDQLIGSLHQIEATTAPTPQFVSGMVTRVFAAGYRRGDSIIRQAKVEIASEAV